VAGATGWSLDNSELAIAGVGLLAGGVSFGIRAASGGGMTTLAIGAGRAESINVRFERVARSMGVRGPEDLLTSDAAALELRRGEWLRRQVLKTVSNPEVRAAVRAAGVVARSTERAEAEVVAADAAVKSQLDQMMPRILREIRSTGGERRLWSGDGMMEVASENGGLTLESAIRKATGNRFETLAAKVNWKTSGPMWRRMSEEWSSGMTLDPPTYLGSVVNPESILLKTELGNVARNGLTPKLIFPSGGVKFTPLSTPTAVTRNAPTWIFSPAR
jgi:hypothetical protein